MITYYSSDYEIGSTLQVMEQMEKIMVTVESMVMIKLWTWKRRKRKTKRAQGKGIIIGPFCFGDQDTIECVITFRNDGHTI